MCMFYRAFAGSNNPTRDLSRIFLHAWVYLLQTSLPYREIMKFPTAQIAIFFTLERIISTHTLFGDNHKKSHFFKNFITFQLFRMIF